MLSNLGPDYSVFFFTFHPSKLTAQNWKMPSLEDFMESLTQKQDKLVLMGTIKTSKDKALVAGDSKVNSKYNNKDNKTPYKKGDTEKS